MKNYTSLSFTLLSCFITLFSAFSVQAVEDQFYQDLEVSCNKTALTKVCPTPDQILISPEGIYVYTPDRDKLLKAYYITVEDGRVCVTLPEYNELVPKRGPCLVHDAWHISPPGCGGCMQPFCKMRCVCMTGR